MTRTKRVRVSFMARAGDRVPLPKRRTTRPVRVSFMVTSKRSRRTK